MLAQKHIQHQQFNSKNKNKISASVNTNVHQYTNILMFDAQVQKVNQQIKQQHLSFAVRQSQKKQKHQKQWLSNLHNVKAIEVLWRNLNKWNRNAKYA